MSIVALFEVAKDWKGANAHQQVIKQTNCAISVGRHAHQQKL